MKGGTRKGAGRPAGVRNKKTAERMAAIEASGETPMDYMLRVMRDPKTTHDRRDRLAGMVAPYVHPRLTSIGGTPDQPVEVVISWAGEK